MLKWTVTTIAVGAVGFMTASAAFAFQTEAPAAQTTPIETTTVARGLQNPWGLAFLGAGRMAVTERPGRLRIVTPDGTVSPPVAGLPDISARGQGGLLDVEVAPDFD